MPYMLRKVRGKNCYRVTNKNTKKRRVFAKCATRKNATLQLRLLNAIHYNKKFVPTRNRKIGTRKRI